MTLTELVSDGRSSSVRSSLWVQSKFSRSTMTWKWTLFLFDASEARERVKCVNVNEESSPNETTTSVVDTASSHPNGFTLSFTRAVTWCLHVFNFFFSSSVLVSLPSVRWVWRWRKKIWLQIHFGVRAVSAAQVPHHAVDIGMVELR
jgi:hypothetical protein